jgi:aminodeoxychorismate synthase component I
VQFFAEALDGWSSPTDAFVSLYVNEPYAFWLDREHSLDDRFSVIGSGIPVDSPEPLRLLDSRDLPFAFRPGVVGVFGYESESNGFLLVDRALVFDHRARQIWFVAAVKDFDEFEHWRRAALLRLALVGGETAAFRNANSRFELQSAKLRHDSSAYLAMIQTAKQHIAAGDVYQICLTNQISTAGNAEPLEVFLRLRALNPTPYAAFLRLGERALACSSPEQFLRVTSDGVVSSKPIKGTRRRDSDAERDVELARELGENVKERAENLMIVDLMRNDIGRVCLPESVTVTKLFDIETYKTVHQLVSTVQGRLQPGMGAADAIAAAFPGGSMTGAPKLRAMEIIEVLEKGPRGIYSGAVGYLGFDGSADLGMVIRSIVFEGDEIHIGVGGGITSDSVPAEELDETKVKAAPLLEALGLGDPWAC